MGVNGRSKQQKDHYVRVDRKDKIIYPKFKKKGLKLFMLRKSNISTTLSSTYTHKVYKDSKTCVQIWGGIAHLKCSSTAADVVL